MSPTSDFHAILDEEKRVAEMQDKALLMRWEEIRQKAQEASETPYSASEGEDATVSDLWGRLQAIEDEQARRWRTRIQTNLSTASML